MDSLSECVFYLMTDETPASWAQYYSRQQLTLCLPLLSEAVANEIRNGPTLLWVPRYISVRYANFDSRE